VLPGLLLTSVGIGLALPTTSIIITNGVRREDQGLAGALFTTSQQAGAAVGLAILATAAAARTAQAAGSLVAGYRLAFLISTALMALSAVMVVALARQRRAPGDPAGQQAADGVAAGGTAGGGVAAGGMPPSGTPTVSLAECQLRKC
jgi:peptidoglycan/LPS O-acetylase OafA/YrhL